MNLQLRPVEGPGDQFWVAVMTSMTLYSYEEKRNVMVQYWEKVNRAVSTKEISSSDDIIEIARKMDDLTARQHWKLDFKVLQSVLPSLTELTFYKTSLESHASPIVIVHTPDKKYVATEPFNGPIMELITPTEVPDEGTNQYVFV